MAPASTSRWRLPFRLLLIGFLAIAAFFLVTEHTAHTLGVLPYLLLLACPLMHFLHHGHGRHGGHDTGGTPPSEDRQKVLRHDHPDHPG
ncbi:MAG: DUF2933 domain-containing protein [Reyranella sp.]|nr:DUF2933 domain-containing protein [Reyranella sp.]